MKTVTENWNTGLYTEFKRKVTCYIIVLTLPPMKAQLAAFMKQI